MERKVRMETAAKMESKDGKGRKVWMEKDGQKR